ncbi:MAG TPA: HEAT repeat domain-containing protein [Thermoanaerobaculia bacterium]|nr:HEAT repeat domain-containing protein [Thermoanaerobaculia bacterium]
MQRWYEAEGGEDSPFIPSDWPFSCWSCLVDLYPDLRYWVAHQPYAPEAVVRGLANDPDWRVRHRVAMKRNLPKDLFPVMAADPAPLVRMAVARNAKTPIELVTELAADANRDVAHLAANSLRQRQHGLP